jgi:hypothetical protein
MLQILRLRQASLPLHGRSSSSLSSWCWVWPAVSDSSSGGTFSSAAASQSLAGASRAFGWKITGMKWGNESWTPRRPDDFDVGTTSASAALPRCSPAGSERLTVTTACASSGWSRPLLPDHAELAASEQADISKSSYNYVAIIRYYCSAIIGNNSV